MDGKCNSILISSAGSGATTSQLELVAALWRLRPCVLTTLLFLAHRTAAELALGHEDVFERFLQTLFTVLIGVWMLRHDGTFGPIYACLTSRHGQLCQICGDQCENGMACMLPYAAANLAHLVFAFTLEREHRRIQAAVRRF